MSTKTGSFPYGRAIIYSNSFEIVLKKKRKEKTHRCLVENTRFPRFSTASIERVVRFTLPPETVRIILLGRLKTIPSVLSGDSHLYNHLNGPRGARVHRGQMGIKCKNETKPRRFSRRSIDARHTL